MLRHADPCWARTFPSALQQDGAASPYRSDLGRDLLGSMAPAAQQAYKSPGVHGVHGRMGALRREKHGNSGSLTTRVVYGSASHVCAQGLGSQLTGK